jgi:hypothetical protein
MDMMYDTPMNIWQILGWFVALPVGVSTLAGAVVIFLGRTLLNHLLSKDVEKFKVELEAVAFKDRTRFTTLHEKRAEVIAELYKKIVETEMAFGAATIDIDLESIGTPEKRLSEASDISHEMKMYYLKNKIYLDESLVTEIDKFDIELGHVYFDLAKIEGIKEPDFKKAQEKMEKIVRPMKKSLERKLQDILGA